jgi:tripartite-type tricarboxylate transporter receptor subunit TctC
MAPKSIGPLARRTLLKATGAAAAAAFLPGMPAVHAQEKQLTLIIGFPAGAGIDVLTRMIADKLRASMNRTVIVENRPGASGRTAIEYVKNQPADGSAMMFVPMSVMTIFPLTYRSLRYDPFKDFTPVTHLAALNLAFAVRAETPVKSLKEYVALVKKDPSANTYGSTGVGTPSHFFINMFERAAGVTMLHVPHKGSADVMNNLLGGHIGAAILTVADISPQNASGKLRALAVSGAKREPSMPDVPTYKEEGYDIEGTFWYGAYTPAGTPADVVNRLNTHLIDAVKSPEVQAWALRSGLNITGTGPDTLIAAQKGDFERWSPIIKASGFVAED